MHLDNLQRRASDIAPREPTLSDVWSILIDIKNKLEDVEAKQVLMDTAFTKNDLGMPDYEGHRASLNKALKAHSLMEDYKVTATKKIVGIAVVFFLGILASGLMSSISSHIK